MQAEQRGKNRMKRKYKGPSYPTKAEGKIPAFKSYEEEANFWDMHSFTEFEDQFEDVDIVFELDKPKEETLIVRLQKDLKKKLENLAKRRGVSLSTLARILLAERLRAVNKKLLNNSILDMRPPMRNTVV